LQRSSAPAKPRLRALGRNLRFDEAAAARYAWPALGAAVAVSFAVILYLSRGTMLSTDELVWFVESPDLDLDAALQPHGGHLTFTSRVLYGLLFEALGPDYLTFRILAAATVALTATLFFVYASRRVGRLPALAPTIVLLFFGSDSLHVLQGNGFTVLLALACGLGALLALERDDRTGDALACALLCLGVVTYTVALAFVAGVALLVLADGRRWSRIWIPLVPLAIYGAWWVWSLGLSSSAESALVLSNLLLIPATTFESLGTVLSALAGLNYPFVATGAGPALALLYVVALGWHMTRGPLPRSFWVVLSIPLVLWSMVALAKFRTPSDPRYLFPSAIAILVVSVEAVRGMRWSRAAMIALGVVAVFGVSTNLALLRDAGRQLRGVYTPTVRAELAAIEIAGERADPAFEPRDAVGIQSPLLLPFAEIAARGEPPTGAYLAAAADLGSPAFTAEQLADQAEPFRTRADAVLVGALGLGLEPFPPGAATRRCRVVSAAPGEDVIFALPPAGAVLRAAGESQTVRVSRFAETRAVSLGEIQQGRPARLRAPADDVAAPWRVEVSGRAVGVCVP
jgi:hypothetical protein